MVFRRDEKGGGWHEPPYTEEEEFEFYRRYNAGMASGQATIYHGRPRGPAGKQRPTSEQPPEEEKAQERDG